MNYISGKWRQCLQPLGDSSCNGRVLPAYLCSLGTAISWRLWLYLHRSWPGLLFHGRQNWQVLLLHFIALHHLSFSSLPQHFPATFQSTDLPRTTVDHFFKKEKNHKDVYIERSVQTTVICNAFHFSSSCTVNCHQSFFHLSKNPGFELAFV